MGDLVTGDYEMLRDGLQLTYQMQMVDRSAADFATNQALGAHYRGIFEQGNIGMLYMGTWYIQALLHDAAQGLHNVRWGIAPAPVGRPAPRHYRQRDARGDQLQDGKA